jgi:Fe-S cluster assembly protein SufD
VSAVAHWQERFAAEVASSAPGLAALRRKALDRFVADGFPTTRLEAWRHTNPARVAREAWQPAPRIAVERDAIEPIATPLYACGLFVFVNGRYDASLSTPPALGGWLGVSSLASDLSEADAPPGLDAVGESVTPFGALNTAFFEDGAHLRVAEGKQVDEPVHIVFVSAPGEEPCAAHPRVLIEAAAGSRIVVIEDHVSLGGGTSLTNGVTEIDVGANAGVEWIKLQREHPSAFHVSEMRARVARDGRLAAATLSFGTALTRNDARVRLEAPGAHCDLRGLFVAGGDQLVDNHTWIDHAEPHGTSVELYKGILDGRARGVFNGRVVVRPDAQKSDARQQNPNLLLSRDAEIATQPQLEIRADDVKCSHGSTVGQLDSDALFYLRSRGVPLHEARDLLMRGFASEITRALSVPALGERADDLVVERLGMARDLPEDA